jgi:hypothetical protein
MELQETLFEGIEALLQKYGPKRFFLSREFR